MMKFATMIAGLTMTVAAPTLRANPAHDQLAGMSITQRASALASLLRASDETCPSAKRTFYQGSDNNGNAFWNVECSGGSAYVIQVNNDARGSTRILSCKALKAVAGTNCFRKL
ncbi:hypothetical protein [Variovorax paradoxus]|uniref:Uncharacterized protein n=1 Tax=Variovorax paradoxus TaxID=34073 RepID=A0A0H2LTM7_VARPD|nr:hypothetical protein [Variovorax paradoxus]KLN53544.1 hypothetical protein VPARA_53830 [Variovorax paradoxus]